MEVEQFIVGGSGIHLEVAGVNDDAERCCDRQRHCADDRMRDADELDLKRTESDLVVRLYAMQFCLFEQFMLFETPLHQSKRECCPVDRKIDLRKQEWNAADMVFVA